MSRLVGWRNPFSMTILGCAVPLIHLNLSSKDIPLLLLLPLFLSLSLSPYLVLCARLCVYAYEHWLPALQPIGAAQTLSTKSNCSGSSSNNRNRSGGGKPCRACYLLPLICPSVYTDSWITKSMYILYVHVCLYLVAYLCAHVRILAHGRRNI
ncbi:hypothetical protein F4809DRAFT_578600 [Biscogniauxia mediterranea]|nr:hypothetical protein F4809DRAFT_578600 [Biscogniauxia mediterranea]